MLIYCFDRYCCPRYCHRYWLSFLVFFCRNCDCDVIEFFPALHGRNNKACPPTITFIRDCPHTLSISYAGVVGEKKNRQATNEWSIMIKSSANGETKNTIIIGSEPKTNQGINNQRWEILQDYCIADCGWDWLLFSFSFQCLSFYLH